MSRRLEVSVADDGVKVSDLGDILEVYGRGEGFSLSLGQGIPIDRTK